MGLQGVDRLFWVLPLLIGDPFGRPAAGRLGLKWNYVFFFVWASTDVSQC